MKTIRIPLIYLKDKQAFLKHKGTMRLIGNPVETARKLKDKGYILIHIVDLDAENGMETNFDVYDKMTYFINIEVECGRNERFIGRLLKIKSRVVVGLPSKIDLKKWSGDRRLLVGRIGKDYTGKAEDVHDLILEEPEKEMFSRFADKRLIVYSSYKGKEKAWGVIFSPQF